MLYNPRIIVMESHQLDVSHLGEEVEIGEIIQRVPVGHADSGYAGGHDLRSFEL
jgi:hypothetical protein